MRLLQLSHLLAAAAFAALSSMLVAPANAQFWDWGQPRRYDPWRDWWTPQPRYEPRHTVPRYRDRERERERDTGREREREAPVDFSHAPPPTQKKPEASVTILVMGDANADWLAYGLEEAYAEKPEIAVVRKHRTDSGLIRYDPRRDIDWAQTARETLAAERPKFIVMMIGNNDRQSIREKVPPAVRPTAPAPNSPKGAPAPPQMQTPPAAAVPGQRDAEQQSAEVKAGPGQSPTDLPLEQARLASYGPWEFHTEKWEAAYIRRIDAAIAALKSAGVPVIWVGLPAQRNTKPSTDSVYLNELYRSRAEKAGITYVDVWDGFVDDGGRFSPQGPDYEGQIRRLRSGDGIYFTKFGARKLAHYVDKEIERYLNNRPVPVALPPPTETNKPSKPSTPPGAPSQRPAVGPVVPLTVNNVQAEELLGGGRAATRTPASDGTASRVLNKGEPLQPARGRADDFSWPRSAVEVDQSALEYTPSPPPAASSPETVGTSTPAAGQQHAGEPKPIQRRGRTGTGEGPLKSLQQIFPGLFRF
jgi:uncharacterized protein